MANVSFSDHLRIERERSGMDLNEVSRRLHIRPDILNSIEHADFDRMPARGYSKNMIRAYARLLGLDEIMITDMFLDEINQHEMGVPAVHQDHRRSRRGRSETASADIDTHDLRGRGDRDRSASRRLGPRRETDDRAASRGQRGQGRGKKGQGTARAASEVGLSRVSALFGGRSKQDGRIPSNFNTIGSTPPYAKGANDRRGAALDRINLPILLAVIAAIIIVLIVVVIISNSFMQANEDVPSIPVSGLTDTSGEEGDGMEASEDQPTAPTSVEFEFSIESGASVWIEVYEDGDTTPSLAEVANGPMSESFDITGEFEFKTTNPNVVTCTLDGEDIELEPDASGYYVFTIDFDEYLEDWEVEHGLREAKSSSSKSSSSKSSSDSSSSKGSSSSRSSSSKSTSSSSRSGYSSSQ